MPSLPLDLTVEAAGDLLGLADTSAVAVEFLRPSNHTWRVDTGASSFYVKAHTKSWYSGVEDAAGAVRHEQVAHQILAAAGLPTPTVVRADFSTRNAIGWPHLITVALTGLALPQVLVSAEVRERDAAMRAAGRHLRAMHDLVFDHPGYLAETASPMLTDPRGWQHPIWRFERFLQSTFRVWADDAATVSPHTMDALVALLAETMPALRKSFVPPLYTHGDCHANGIFLGGAGSDWAVTGVLDLEVASAANPAFDFNKLIIELVGLQRHDDYDWWTPLFDGYGHEPHFGLTRLLLVSAAHSNYACLDHTWGLGREDIVDHVLRASTWPGLFRPEPRR